MALKKDVELKKGTELQKGVKLKKGTVLKKGKAFSLSNEQWFALALLLACFLFPSILKPYVDTFAFGRSYARVYGIGIYFALLAFSKPLLSFAASKFRFEIPPNLSAKIAIVSLSILFIYGLWGQLHLVSQFSGRLGEMFFAFDSRGYTISQFSHTHVLKTIFCPINPSDDIDCARPLLKYLPQFYEYPAMLLFALAAISLAFSYSALKSAPDKAAFAVLSFAVLRVVTDGGLFSYSFVAFPMLAFFLLSKEKRVGWSMLGLPVGWLVVAAVPAVIFGYAITNPLDQFLPLALLLYPICAVLHEPRRFFPFIIISLLSPTLLLDTSVYLDRWQPDPCAGIGLDYGANVTLKGFVYTPCDAQLNLSCGTLYAGNGNFTYNGFLSHRLSSIVARGLSQACGNGVFSIYYLKDTTGGIPAYVSGPLE